MDKCLKIDLKLRHKNVRLLYCHWKYTCEKQ